MEGFCLRTCGGCSDSTPNVKTCTVKVQVRDEWRVDRRTFANRLEFEVSSKVDVPVPWKLAFYNENYESVISAWNIAESKIVDGLYTGTAKLDWQFLRGNGPSGNLGLILLASSRSFEPQYAEINGISCNLEIV